MKITQVSRLTCVAFLLSSPAWAGAEIDSARNAKARAMNEFSAQVYANPKMSADERAQLRQRTVGAANAKLRQAENTETGRFADRLAAEQENHNKIALAKRAAKKGAKGTALKDAKSDGGPAKGASAPPPPKRKEVVLDGSKIKKEIEFKPESDTEETPPSEVIEPGIHGK